MADEAEIGGEDIGWWNCSLCTYKNSADKYKCEICDLRRGTSTRKPRSSADTIVAQVVKQQEQIRQQTRAKPSPKTKTGVASATSNATPSGTPTQLTATASNSDPAVYKTKKSSISKTSAGSISNESKKPSSTLNSGSLDQHQMETEGSVSRVNQNRAPTVKKSCCQRCHLPPLPHYTGRKSSSSAKRPKDGKDNQPAHKNHNLEDDHQDDDTDSDNTSVVSEALSQTISPNMEKSASESSLDNSSQYSSSPAMTPQPTTSSPNNLASLDSKQLPDHPFKIRPVEIIGNLIKYSPPTSSGRTGLIIDKKRFTQHSVTVNDVTITFTEFATRQNKYVRKKKKKRTGKAALPTQASTNATNANSAAVAE